MTVEQLQRYVTEEDSAITCPESIDCAAEHLRRMRFDVLQDIPSGSMHISSGSEAFPCPLGGCNGSMARKFSSHDLYTQLSYLRYLFDHQRQRDNLQGKCACYHAASITSRQLRFLQWLSAHRSPESVSSVALPRADKDTLPRLSHNEMDAMDDIQNEVDRFLEHSAYSFLDLGFLTSTFKS